MVDCILQIRTLNKKMRDGYGFMLGVDSFI